MDDEGRKRRSTSPDNARKKLSLDEDIQENNTGVNEPDTEDNENEQNAQHEEIELNVSGTADEQPEQGPEPEPTSETEKGSNKDETNEHNNEDEVVEDENIDDEDNGELYNEGEGPPLTISEANNLGSLPHPRPGGPNAREGTANALQLRGMPYNANINWNYVPSSGVVGYVFNIRMWEHERHIPPNELAFQPPPSVAEEVRITRPNAHSVYYDVDGFRFQVEQSNMVGGVPNPNVVNTSIEIDLSYMDPGSFRHTFWELHHSISYLIFGGEIAFRRTIMHVFLPRSISMRLVNRTELPGKVRFTYSQNVQLVQNNDDEDDDDDDHDHHVIINVVM